MLGPNAYRDVDKPHLLAGAYYSVEGDLTATLMLNNKGPRPLEVRPALFSLAGERLDIPPVTVEANSFRMIDLREWAAPGGPSFQQGSIMLFHLGRDLVLGAQIYLVDEIHSLSFDEKLTEITNGGPSRLEGVWWDPSPDASVQLALSNASDSPLAVTARFAGAKHDSADATTFDLAPHETRLIDVSRDFRGGAFALPGGKQGGKRAVVGAVSLERSGEGGLLLARAMVQDRNTGYSSTVQLSAPEKGKSARLEGAGFRLRGPAGELLTPVVVARNVGDSVTTLRGRMPYSTADGNVEFINVPRTRLAPGEVKVVELDGAIKKSGLTTDVMTAGMEFEYATEPGSVIMAAHSMSDDGNQVYRVPIWDPLAQRSPTGGYPWYIEGDSSTTVYVKNITDREQGYTAHLIFEGGRYAFGLNSIKPHQTVTIDLRALRDNQVPDEQGRTIPLDVTRGQILWSLRRAEESEDDDEYARLALIGRSEQTSAAKGVSSSYACVNCCGDTFFDGYVTPGGVLADVGNIAEYVAYEQSSTCYGGWTEPYEVSPSWSTSDTNVATVEKVGKRGWVTARAPGSVNVRAKWNMWHYVENPCDPEGPFFMMTAAVEPSAATSAAAPACGDCYSHRYEHTSSAGMQVRPSVSVTGASICDDRINIRLEPANVTGFLRVFLDGPGGTVELAWRNQQGGDTREFFYTVNLPNQEFTRIRATWSVNNVVGTGTLDYHMVVLGEYNQTCYNTPLEGDYSGNSVSAGTATSQCAWSSRNFVSGFLDEVNENGSGVDSSNTWIQLEGFCGSAPASSPSYCDRYGYSCSRYRRPADVRTQCNNPPQADITVARGPGSSLSCGTPVFIAGIGCRVVEDRGGGVAADQLDNYKGVGNAACQGWGNARRKTVKLF